MEVIQVVPRSETVGSTNEPVEQHSISPFYSDVQHTFPPLFARRILGLESYPHRIEYNGRLISVSICPMGIHPEAFEITPEVT